MERSAYGARIGKRFGLAPAPTLVTNMSGHAPIMFARLQTEAAGHTATMTAPAESAYAVHVLVQASSMSKLIYQRRPAPIFKADQGSVFLFDLEKAPVVHFEGPFDTVRFQAAKETLRELAEENGLRWLDGLKGSAWGVPDPVLLGLASSLLPALEHPAEANALFMEHITLAFFARLMLTYSGLPSPSRTASGGLAPWQLRRVKDLMAAHLADDVSLSDLAKECALSPGYFARAFRSSLGLPPHQWLLERRIELSKRLLLGSAQSLSDIAEACGFADQSHLTKVFSRQMGTTPGAWKRAQS